MKLKILGLSILFLCAFFVAHSVNGAVTTELQSKIDATKRERDALLEEQRKIQAELDAISREGQSLQGAVRSLDTTKKKLANDLRLTQTKISSTNLNIQSLESSMSEKEKQIRDHRLAISTSIQGLKNYDNHSLLADILTYDSLSEVWNDRGTLGDLTGKLQDQIRFLEDTKTELAKEKELKEKNKTELVDLSGQLAGQKQVVEQNQQTKAQLLAATKNKEAAYQQLLKDNIAREQQFEAELFKLESQSKITLNSTLMPNPAHGILSWPLATVFVTQRFGKTVGGQQLYAAGFHNGVDFRAPTGTAVKAVMSGVIEGTGNTDEQRGCYSYGRWILIRHPNGLSTIYGHLSASLVTKGQAVATGQIIGYSGGAPGANGSGFSTGPHLHVGLFATQGVEIKQFVTSVGCKQIFVPIAKGIEAYLDPLAYMPAY